MAINSLTFDGVNTKDYGIYISGLGVFDAPTRRYETVTVPGRNGQYVIDEGTYDNIEITYPAFVTDYTQYSFAERMSQIRNVFGSKSGYCRLYDSYNPDEFRLALFGNGVEVEPKHYNSTGEFNLIFNCKPQRYLVSGETPIPITSGQKLINSTFFEAKPLVIVTADGDGAVYVNERPIIFEPTKIGDIELDNTKPTARVTKSSGSWSSSATAEWTEDHYHTGDDIKASAGIQFKFTASYPGLTDHLHDDGNNITIDNASIDRTNQAVTFVITVQKNALKFTAGTSKSVSFLFSTIIKYETDPGSGVLQDSLTFSGTVVYDGNKTITINANGTVPSDARSIAYALESVPSFVVDSSVSAFENEVYFDCGTYDAYTYDNQGTRISVNKQISAGAGFPVLKPGENGISYFGGINSCKIVPRWWKI